MPNIWFRWIHRDNWIFNRKNTSKVNSAGILRKKYITYARIYQNIAKHILNKRSLLATVKSNIFKSFSSLSFPRRCWYKTYETIIYSVCRFNFMIWWICTFAGNICLFNMLHMCDVGDFGIDSEFHARQNHRRGLKIPFFW